MSTRERRRGQGIVEYVIIVGLIAVLLIGAVKFFGDSVTNAYEGVTGGIEDVATQLETFSETPEGWRGEEGNGSPTTSPASARCRHRAVDPATRQCRRCGRRVG